MSGRTTPSGIPSSSHSGRMTPSGIPSSASHSGRITPSASGRATPSGIPSRSSVQLGSGIPSAVSGRSTPSGTRSVSGGGGAGGKRESTGLASPYSGGAGKRESGGMAQAPPPQQQQGQGGQGGKRESLLPPASPRPSSALGNFQPTPTPSADGTSVQVALRIRPAGYDANVPSRFQRVVVNASNATTVTVDSAPPNATAPAPAAAKPQKFLFDRVYGPDEGQDAVWTSVEGLVGRFLEGYNVTVFAYGQTSSGKSYTMGTDRLHGPYAAVADARLGIVPRAIRTLFAAMAALRSPKMRFATRNSYIEIYNEDLIDLLASSASSGPGAVLPQVQIREDKDGRIIWSGLREEGVDDVEGVMANLERGSAVRQTNSTDMNAQSSRSHAIFSISLTQKRYNGTAADPPPPPGERTSRLPPPRVTSPVPGGGGNRSGTPTEGHRGDAGTGEWVTVTSKFHFVDLAGSERLKRTAAAGERIKEGISINSGLHALGNVISALGDPSKARTTTHIPYRDSKLTRLLQDSLGGNAHTLMIACVSPSEYNLNETLNTLKYANRARNIKNRAEVNEVEVGWDDVEHLQSLILKLRRELAYLRSGNLDPNAMPGEPRSRPLSSIDEEGGLGLRADISELQNKYAKALADLAVAQQQQQHDRSASEASISQTDFEGLIQPVVEEYEKSITALESQLALTRAALSHSEESMREQEEKLGFEQQVNETNAGVIGDLKSRVAKLAERDALNEGYIRDLEGKLKVLTEQEEGTSGTVAELKREVAKYREGESKAESYIKELEARLGQSDEAQATLKTQVDALEREVERREAAYKELEERVALLDTSDQQKMLLQELDEREKKVLELEHVVDQHSIEKQAFEREKKRFEEAARKAGESEASLQAQIKELEERTAAASAAAAQMASAVQSSSANPRQRLNSDGGGVSPRSLTPPATPADELVSPALRVSAASDDEQLSERFAELQGWYDNTLAELEVVNAKYKDALRELEDLSKQVEEARLISTESSDRVPFPSPCPSPSPRSESFGTVGAPTPRGLGFSVGGEQEEMEVLSTPRSASTTPTSKSPRIRRSMPINGRISFLGRQAPLPSSTVHGRSMSLSQELSSVPGARGSLLNTPTSERSVSPVSAREQERSHESLQKEIMKLQEALKEREEEINALERSLHDMRRRGSDSESRTSEEESERSRSDGLPTRSSSLPAPETPAEVVNPDGSVKLSPSTTKAFDDLKAQLAQHGIDGVDDPKSVQRLDDLMRSMAKKESAHLELIEDLKERLAVRTRQHEDLEKLSRDQVVNMSTEIDALRKQLGDMSTESEAIQKQLEEMEQALATKQDELQRRREEARTALEGAAESLRVQHEEALSMRDEEHADVLRRTQEEHADVLRRMLDEREELFVAKTRQFEEAQQAAASAHEAKLVSLSEEHGQALAAKDQEHAQALQEQIESHRQALEQLTAEHQRVRDSADGDSSSREDELTAEHAKQLQEREAAHANALEELRLSHNSTLSTTTEQHRIALEELQKRHDDVTTQMIEDHAAAIAQIREEHTSRNSALEASHAKALAELKSSHEATSAQLSSTHSDELAKLRASHEQELEDVRNEHEEILVASLTELDSRRSKKHETAVAALKSEHAEAVARLTAEHEEALERVQGDGGEGGVGEVEKVKAEHAAALASQQAAHEAMIVSLKSSHATELETAFAQQGSNGAQEELARQVGELQTAKTAVETDRDLQAEKVDQLTRDFEAAVASHRSEVEQLRGHLDRLEAIEDGSRHPTEVEAELREALDTLNELDRALTDSHAERDRLAASLEEEAAKRAERDGRLEGVTKELAAVKGELAQMKARQQQLETRRPSDASTSSDLGKMGGKHPLGVNGRSETPVDGSAGTLRTSKPPPPPPTPPPSVPPPPIPTSLPSLPSLPSMPSSLSGVLRGGPSPMSSPPLNNGTAGMANGKGHQQHTVRASNASSTLTGSDSMSGGSAGERATSLAESVSMDPRVMKKLEEQEAAIAKLTKQLSHCENDLKANIDLVSNLESALNDSERNLRKSRLQMNELAKERDKLSSANDSLRQQLSDAQSEVDDARHSVVREKASFDARLDEERKAKEIARRQLESRMEEMQNSRAARKSKFNCF